LRHTAVLLPRCLATRYDAGKPPIGDLTLLPHPAFAAKAPANLVAGNLGMAVIHPAIFEGHLAALRAYRPLLSDRYSFAPT
jgi:hypothetical protein